MSAARKIELWARIEQLLREYEDAQSAAVKAEIAKAWQGLRQQLTAVAMDTASDEEIT